MDCWQLIGIEPTVDKMTIKRAYARQLKQYNPEDNPEGFKALRSALEEALEAARFISLDEINTVEPVDADSIERESDNTNSEPAKIIMNDVEITTTELGDKEKQSLSRETVDKIVATFMDKVVAIYGDLDQRKELKVWQDAVESQPTWNLDARIGMTFSLFHFIGHYFYIPTDVFKYLDDYFSWSDNYQVLVDEFGEQTVDRVLDHFAYEQWRLGYQDVLFTTPLDVNAMEHYFALRERFEYLILNESSEGMEAVIKELNEIDVQDFELDRLFYLYYLNQNEPYKPLFYADKLAIKYPHRIEGYLFKAQINLRHHAVSVAADNYKSALLVDEHHDVAMKGLARCYLALNDLFSAKCLYEQLLLQTPFDVEARIQLIQINQKMLDESFAILQQKPNHSRALKQIAESYIEIGAYQECATFLEQRIKKTKPFFEPLLKLIRGSIVSVTFRWLFLSKIDQVFGFRNSELHHMLGIAYQALNQPQLAINAYLMALDKAKLEETNGYPSLVRLGQLYNDQENYKEGLAMLQKAHSFTPNSDEILASMAKAQFELGFNDQALKSINRAISLNSEPWRYYFMRGSFLLFSGQPLAARADLNHVISLNSLYYLAWYRLGLCNEELELKSEAIDCFKSSLSCSPSWIYPALHWLDIACEIKDLESSELAMEAYLATTDSDVEEVEQYQQAIIEMKLKVQQEEASHA
ncbi:hypothetical protein L0B53_02030 [Vibrio sp. SS-MA-C1-2]|uniref:J domain-containing protein n=1 Tax=Vibrio sp. SS-MA-C1-2 TaxID=2908646 RepID=UPI001F350574|nr:J domain-containing protein [Vibrio sp. SS-MA-C1-2]UJF17572.1 hypothetical protein L0B53_02030 [Vibrio sp. SS-MA-C1-2]